MRKNKSNTALLLVDFMNPLDFEGAAALAPKAITAAKATVSLKRRCHAAHMPSIYANDNFGRWDSEFSATIRSCIQAGGAAAQLAELLAPGEGDLSVLKPRHSAFYGTPLEFLLTELEVDTLIITGIAADSCVMFTAMDAFLRNYRVWVPPDCVAAETQTGRDRALRQLAAVAKVWTGPSKESLAEGVKHSAALHR